MYRQFISPKLSLKNNNTQGGEMLACIKVINKTREIDMLVWQHQLSEKNSHSCFAPELINKTLIGLLPTDVLTSAG